MFQCNHRLTIITFPHNFTAFLSYTLSRAHFLPNDIGFQHVGRTDTLQSTGSKLSTGSGGRFYKTNEWPTDQQSRVDLVLMMFHSFSPSMNPETACRTLHVEYFGFVLSLFYFHLLVENRSSEVVDEGWVSFRVFFGFYCETLYFNVTFQLVYFYFNCVL